MEEPKKLESLAKNPTEGRVKLLYALPYLACMVYLMQIDGDIFMSLSIIKGQLYQFYLEMKPKDGDSELTKEEIDRTIQILLAGAHTTIEQQLGQKQTMDEKLRSAEVVRIAENAFGKKKKELLN